MKPRLSKRKNIQPDPESAVSLNLTALDGSPIVDLKPETVSIYRRWYTYLSREEPLPKRLGLISAVRGEGVTSVSIGLAAVMAADLEARIALVECNWWASGLAEAVHLPPAPGFSDLILGQASIEEVSRPCSLSNLVFIPSGQLPEVDRSRTARGAALLETLTNLNKEFDFLILDLPAILAVKDSPVLAGLSDALCLVIRQGVTPIPVIKKALDEVEHLHVRGVILNGVNISLPKALTALL